MTTWGFAQGAVYDVLREHGPMFIAEVVAAFGHDATHKGANSAAAQTLQALFRSGVATRETLEPYAAGNPSRFTRTRYTAVVVEPDEVEQASD